MTVFVLQEETIKLSLENKVLELIEYWGFTIIEAHDLSAEEAECFYTTGTWREMGIPSDKNTEHMPTKIIVTLDLLPTVLSREEQIDHPNLQNSRVIRTKRKTEEILKESGNDLQYGVFHFSNNDIETWEYMKLIYDDEKIREIINIVDEHIDKFRTKEYVIKDLTHLGFKAKIELIDVDNERYVKKTFKPHATKYLNNELIAIQVLSPIADEMPQLISKGENFIIYKYYKDILLRKKSGTLIWVPVKIAKRIIAFLEKVYDQGYAIVDFNEGGIIYDKYDKLKIIDFELFYKYKEKPDCFEKSYDIVGSPVNFIENHPKFAQGYYIGIYKAVGLDVHSLKHGNIFVNYIKVIWFFLILKPIKKAIRVKSKLNFEWMIKKASAFAIRIKL